MFEQNSLSERRSVYEKRPSFTKNNIFSSEEDENENPNKLDQVGSESHRNRSYSVLDKIHMFNKVAETTGIPIKQGEELSALPYVKVIDDQTKKVKWVGDESHHNITNMVESSKTNGDDDKDAGKGSCNVVTEQEIESNIDSSASELSGGDIDYQKDIENNDTEKSVKPCTPVVIDSNILAKKSPEKNKSPQKGENCGYKEVVSNIKIFEADISNNDEVIINISHFSDNNKYHSILNSIQSTRNDNVLFSDRNKMSGFDLNFEREIVNKDNQKLIKNKKNNRLNGFKQFILRNKYYIAGGLIILILIVAIISINKRN
jgi:hypothetical protein